VIRLHRRRVVCIWMQDNAPTNGRAHPAIYSRTHAHCNRSLTIKHMRSRPKITGVKKISKYRQRSNSPSSNYHALLWNQ
jgi:hypothetical protein